MLNIFSKKLSLKIALLFNVLNIQMTSYKKYFPTKLHGYANHLTKVFQLHVIKYNDCHVIWLNNT